MNHGVFVLNDGQLVELSESPYDSEAVLQTWLAKHPNLLQGAQMNSTDPRRWLLVSRELSLPGEDGGGARWSVDHLFIDQDAIPTIVEVKRSSDTRIRREVVGQMLDYASNGSVYWTFEDLRAAFENRCQTDGVDPEEQVRAHWAVADGDQSQFWQTVIENLRAGRVRMVFVSDVIPNELKRIVEFLNEQMRNAEVLAVEIRQFSGEGLQTLVPRVIGQTTHAQGSKQRAAKGSKWTWARMQPLLAEKSQRSVEVASAVLHWAETAGLRIWWGEGREQGSFMPILDHGGQWYGPVFITSNARAELWFDVLRQRRPFDDLRVRQEFVAMLEQVPGLQIDKDRLERRPNFRLDVVQTEQDLRQLLAALDWFVDRARREQGASSRE